MTQLKTRLEYELRRYAAVKKGTTLSIWHKESEYRFEVVDAKPSDMVSIHNTDVEVDFEDSTTTTGNINFGGSVKQTKESSMSTIEDKKGFEAFGGRGELQDSGAHFFADKDQSEYRVCSNWYVLTEL